MIRTILVILITTFIQLKSVGQFSIPIQSWAQEVENRTLVIRLSEENQKKIKQLQKNDKQALEDYKKRISEHNDRLKNLIPKYWPFKNKIEFKFASEVEEIVKNKDDQYIILHCKWTEEILQSVKVYYKYEAYTILLYYPEFAKKIIKRYQVDDNGGGYSSNLQKGQYIFKVSFPDYALNERNLKFAFQQYKEFIERAKTEGYKMKINRFTFNPISFDKKHSSILKQKILLIPKELLTIDVGQIKDVYSAPYKVVPLDQIDELLDNDKNYAYYDFVWSDRWRSWTLLIIDNSTGMILAENLTTDKKIKIHIGLAGNYFNNEILKLYESKGPKHIINAKHLQKLSKLME